MNIIDTRDLHDRLEELKAKQDEIQNKKDEIEALRELMKTSEFDKDADNDDLDELIQELRDMEVYFDKDEQEELDELENMESEIPEWRHGETLIPEDEWIDYVEELCKDIGDVPRESPWYIEIDWDKTAENIKADYSEIEYRGTTYLYRSC